MGNAAKNTENAVPVMRKVGVQPNPSSVPALIETEQRVHGLGQGNPVETNMAFAAEQNGGVAHIDRDLLLLAGPEPMYFGGHQGACGNRSLRCRPDAKG